MLNETGKAGGQTPVEREIVCRQVFDEQGGNQRLQTVKGFSEPAMADSPPESGDRKAIPDASCDRQRDVATSPDRVAMPIVSGWYTTDYWPWLDKLLPTIKAIGLEHDFIPADCSDQGRDEEGWEAKTMRKAFYALQAMARHPGRTLLFIDVDCIVTGTRQDVIDLCDIPGDIGIYFRSRFNRHGKVRIRPRSGTLVIRPTDKARAFLEAWRDASERAPAYQIDEASLLVTLGRVPGCSITLLSQTAVAINADRLETPQMRPVILHASASVDSKTPGLWRWLGGRPLWRNWFNAEM